MNPKDPKDPKNGSLNQLPTPKKRIEDSVVLALALILYLIMNCSCLDVFFTLVASPFIGPAAAICAALGQREAKRVAQWSGEGHQALLA